MGLMNNMSSLTCSQIDDLAIAMVVHTGLFALLWMERGLWGKASQNRESGEPSAH
jgi:hypothetical protein